MASFVFFAYVRKGKQPKSRYPDRPFSYLTTNEREGTADTFYSHILELLFSLTPPHSKIEESNSMAIEYADSIGTNIITKSTELIWNRFYADGLVIRTSTNITPDRIIKWFNRETVESKNRPKGTYTISGPKFATTSSAGIVELEGEIQGDNLILRSHCHINGYRGVYEYAFIQLDALSRPET